MLVLEGLSDQHFHIFALLFDASIIVQLNRVFYPCRLANENCSNAVMGKAVNLYFHVFIQWPRWSRWYCGCNWTKRHLNLTFSTMGSDLSVLIMVSLAFLLSILKGILKGGCTKAGLLVTAASPLASFSYSVFSSWWLVLRCWMSCVVLKFLPEDLLQCISDGLFLRSILLNKNMLVS